MQARSRSSYSHVPLVIALALALLGCGAGQSAPEQSAREETAGQAAPEEEKLPPPPEPAEAPPLTVEPHGTVVEDGAAPDGLVFDPETGLVAAGLRDPDALALVDGRSGAVVRRVPLAESPRHLQLAGPGGPVLVPAERANALIRVGLPGGGIEGETPVGEFPHDAAGSANGRVFVANEFGDSVSVVEGDREVEKLEAPVQPGGVAATQGGVVGVVGVRGLMLEAYDAETLRSLGRIEAGEGPTHVISGPDNRFYVADTRGGAILVYGTRPEPELLHRVDLPGSPYGIAIDPEQDQLWVTLTAQNRVVRYALGTGAPRRLDDYPTVRQPNSVAVDPSTGRVFVASATDGTLQLLDPR